MRHYTINYGINNNQIDVTDIAYNKCVIENIIHIPRGEAQRTLYFSDPLWGVLKQIFVTDKISNITYTYNSSDAIFIDTINNKIYVNDIPDHIETKYWKKMRELKIMHTKIKLDYGSFLDEFPEQMMAMMYLTGNEKVLEIGGNIGRNSIIIASLLKDQSNLVVLESDTKISTQLIHNRNLNNMNFFVENSALSKRKLIQKVWDTIASDTLLDGYTEVNIISWQDLNTKYNIKFDTLVLDCEGAFYYILMDTPEILTNVKLIIMENDYYNIDHKNYINDILKQNNFVVNYSEAGGWGPCKDYFFEVWVKKSDVL